MNNKLYSCIVRVVGEAHIFDTVVIFQSILKITNKIWRKEEYLTSKLLSRRRKKKLKRWLKGLRQVRQGRHLQLRHPNLRHNQLKHNQRQLQSKARLISRHWIRQISQQNLFPRISHPGFNQRQICDSSLKPLELQHQAKSISNLSA